MEVKDYIRENEPRFMDELFSLIRIPSISAQPEHKDDMLACAQRWRELLLAAGADEAMVMPSQGNPLVYAEKRVSPDAPTVLIYAHYDVMPPEPLELWKSQPFEPEIRDGHLFARGADDDKGQSFIQVKAFEYMVREGALKHNVKFIFEGEEEIGSPSLNAFLKEHKELLKADVILVSDTSMLGADLAHHRTARTCLLGNRGHRTQPRPSLGTLRWSRCQPHQRALFDALSGSRCRRTHHRPPLL